MSDDQSGDPGSTIGTGGESGLDTIDGGIGPADERAAGEATQSTGVGAEARRAQDPPPDGHLPGASGDEDAIRRGGDDR